MSDHWDFYFCRVDEKVASMFVDLGLIRDTPVPRLTEMVYLRLYLRFPRPDGLTSDDEFDTLVALEEEILQAIVGEKDVIYVGRNTTDGFREFVFYTTDSPVCQTVMQDVMQRHKDYRFDLGSRPDPSWRVYREFLYPSDVNRQTIANRQVYQSLKESGDALSEPREVDHWVYFSDAYSRNIFIDDCRELGFATRALMEPEGSNDKFGVQVYRVDAPNPESLDGIVSQLFELARASNGEYDGWETRVIKG